MRCGVFLCQCGGNISGVLDLDALAAEMGGFDGVAEVQINQFMCGTEGHGQISKAIDERGLDHLVVGSCSPRFQGPTFERIARDLGLGENAVAFANLREGCSFVHKDQPELAQEKAGRILRAAVTRAAYQHDLPRRRTFLHRSALIVGGGIAGMTAAEELAASGIEVHMVERQASLGGYMARLSKTFPTEDCAMCSLAPRLTDTALNPRIHVHTLTDVESISGPPGEFSVTLAHHPRFVSETCVGCGECVDVCPVKYGNSFDFNVAERTAISRPFSNAVPATFHIERNGWSPCKSTCPVNTSTQGYVALIAAGRFEEAYRVASEPNPFSSVCGRICTRLCEVACERAKLDEPIAIAQLKRYVADTVGPTVPVEPAPLMYDEKVAIVGGGPAGLTAARDLANLGYRTTVFEAQPVAGGMLRLGIPDYRLPKDVLQREIDAVTARGVDLRLGQRCGHDFTVDGLLADGYSSVFLATGLQQSAAAQLPGDDLPGVLRAVEFLRDVNLAGDGVNGPAADTGVRDSAGQAWPVPRVGEQVVVIGGGDVALDAARSALRLQVAAGREPNVTLVYRRTKVEMPANASEVEEAREEGLSVEFLVIPLEIVAAGGAKVDLDGAKGAGKAGERPIGSIRLQRCELGDPDESGRRQPVPLAGQEFELPADTVIFAVGQSLVTDFLQGCEGVACDGDALAIDRATMMTSKPGVFAGGDVAPEKFLTAIEAIAAGSAAARAIHNYLRGEALLPVWPEIKATARPDEARMAGAERQRRVPIGRPDGVERRNHWHEVNLPYSTEEAVAEAQRCLDCAVCSECGSCVQVCPAHSIDFDDAETTEEITVGAVLIASGHQEFDAHRKTALGFGRHANVLTQSQLSRLLSASGPTEGELVRPSDGMAPRSVLMLQCVGSRDCSSSGNEHCSAVCCLFATLHSSLIKQHDPSIEVTIGYTDMRTPGKAHEEYYKLVQSRGVHYVRGRIGEIQEEPDKSLRVRFEDTMTGRKYDEQFDMVVLSAGLEASDGTREIAHVAGLQTGAAGFIKEYHPKLRPVDTQRAGMFVCGTAQGPKNIPDSIAQAKAAAARAVSMLSTGFVLTPAQVAASDEDVCIGCGVCETICPQGAVTLSSGADAHAIVDPNICRGCGICAADCPSGAIQLGGFSDAELLAEVSG
jgi:heterodisulfide reductase subunit A2